MAEFKEYPKMIYPTDGGKGIIVNSKEEEAKLVATPTLPKIGRASCRERVSSPV